MVEVYNEEHYVCGNCRACYFEDWQSAEDCCKEESSTSTQEAKE